MDTERSCIVFLDRIKKHEDDWWELLPIFREISEGSLSGSYEEFGRLWQELKGISKRLPSATKHEYFSMAIKQVVLEKQRVAPNPTGAIVVQRRKR